jgi:hypothetical protein
MIRSPIGRLIPTRLRPIAVLPALLLLAACAAAAPIPSPTATPTPTSSLAGGIRGRALAGPTCPVETVPPDPNCAPRPVAGAVLIVRDASGREVARATTDADGSYVIALPPGSYTVDPQEVEGLLTKAETATVVVPATGFAQLDWAYDTGIR